jgi:hypothetical protein
MSGSAELLDELWFTCHVIDCVSELGTGCEDPV